MSKIYEALRRHDSKPWNDGRELVRQSVLDNATLAPNRQMQALYRSVEALVSATSTGAMIMFSSAHRGEGKTTVCGSFASTLAQNLGKSVLILDADNNRALSHQWGTEKDAVATLQKAPEIALPAPRSTGTRGDITVTPIAAIAGSASTESPDLSILASIKGKLTKTFDYVLIDAPSLSDAAWSPAVGAVADGVILVVEAERTRWPVALNSKNEFEASGAKILGVFLNKRRFYIPPRLYRRI
jgi:Mrp family chromosome partitioning ATPase